MQKQLAPVSESVLKALFIGTCLSNILKRMGTTKAVPERLNSQECKRNPGQSNPPILYIPKRDVVPESLAIDNIANTMSLAVPGKVELRVSV